MRSRALAIATRRVAAVVLAVALAPAADAQSLHPLDEIRAHVEAADEAMKAGDKELCTLEATKANRLLDALDDGGEHANLRRRIKRLVGRADPRSRNRTTTLKNAAAKLVKVAEAYLADGWTRVALPLLEQARRLHAPTARAALEAVDSAMQRASGELGTATIGELFEDGRVIWGEKDWSIDDERIVTPRFGPGSHLLLSNRRLRLSPRGGTVELEFETTMRRGHVCLVFAYRHPEDFYTLRWSVENGSGHLRLQRVFGREEPETLVFANYDFDPNAPAEWTKLVVRTTGGKLVAQLGDHAPIDVPAATGDVHGFLGLLMHGVVANTEPTAFRNLRLQKVTP